MKELEVKFVKLSKRACVPKYATEGAAGADLFACLDAPMTLSPRERALVPTGLKVGLPENTAGFVFARSGLAHRKGLSLSNGVGVIDCDYTGELKVAVVNLSDTAVTVEDGERIAQLVVAPVYRVEFKETDTLEKTKRGSGGFGSTGTK
ncbi:MAG: dUTP diphosphatase [Clostridia bacterium]|nr:dUTP diphosphatase [Clostridia bacterium]